MDFRCARQLICCATLTSLVYRLPPIAETRSHATTPAALKRGSNSCAHLLHPYALPACDRWRASFPFVRSINFAFPGVKFPPGSNSSSRREFSREQRDRETPSRARFRRQVARRAPTRSSLLPRTDTARFRCSCNKTFTASLVASAL